MNDFQTTTGFDIVRKPKFVDTNTINNQHIEMHNHEIL